MPDNVIPMRRREDVVSDEYERFIGLGLSDTRDRAEAIRRANEASCWRREGLSFEHAYAKASLPIDGPEDEPVLAATLERRERVRELLGDTKEKPNGSAEAERRPDRTLLVRPVAGRTAGGTGAEDDRETRDRGERERAGRVDRGASRLPWGSSAPSTGLRGSDRHHARAVGRAVRSEREDAAELALASPDVARISKAERGERRPSVDAVPEDPREEKRATQQVAKASVGDLSASPGKAAHASRCGLEESTSRAGSEVRGTSPTAVAPLSEAESQMLAPVAEALSPRLFLAPSKGPSELTSAAASGAPLVSTEKATMAPSTDQLEARLLKLLAERGPILQTEVAPLLGCGGYEKRLVFRRLEAAGKVHSIGMTNAARVHLGPAPGAKPRVGRWPKEVASNAVSDGGPKATFIPPPQVVAPPNPIRVAEPLARAEGPPLPLPHGAAPTRIDWKSGPADPVPESVRAMEAEAAALEKRAAMLRKMVDYWSGLARSEASP